MLDDVGYSLLYGKHRLTISILRKAVELRACLDEIANQLQVIKISRYFRFATLA